MRLGTFIYSLLIILASLNSGAVTLKPLVPATGPTTKIEPILVTNRFNNGSHLRGDWDSSGDIDITPPYLPKYSFRYACHVEMSDPADKRSDRLFAIAKFQYTNSSPSVFQSEDLKWQWVLVENDGTEKLFDRPPRDFVSRDQLSLYFNIKRGKTLDQDQVSVFGSISLAVNPNAKAKDIYWVSQDMRESVARSEDYLKAETTIMASSKDKRYPTLSRKVHVVCDKAK